jgi:hypothetical protein
MTPSPSQLIGYGSVLVWSNLLHASFNFIPMGPSKLARFTAAARLVLITMAPNQNHLPTFENPDCNVISLWPQIRDATCGQRLGSVVMTATLRAHCDQVGGQWTVGAHCDLMERAGGDIESSKY